MWPPYFAPEDLVRGNNEDKTPRRDRFFGCWFGSHILPHHVSQCICRFVYVPVSWVGTCHWQPRGVDKYPCIYSPSHRILLTFRVSTHFSVCQCSDAWELEMVPWKGGAEFRNNNRYNLAAQMYQFNLIIYVLFCLLDLKAWATSYCPLSCVWILVQTLPHWWCEEMAITNSFFTGLFVFISLGTLTAPPMGLELCKGAFQGYHVISILPFRSQNR